MGDEGRELFYLTAVEEADGTAGLSGLFFIVGHHYDGASVFFIQLMQQLHDFRTHLGVQITGRLIGEYYLRIADDGARNGNTLALTAGKLCRHVAHTVAQTHLLQYFLCQTATLLGRHLSVQQRQLHVIQYIQRINQVERLEHKPQLPVTESRQFPVLHAVHLNAGYFNRSAGRRIQQTHNVQQSRLTATGRTHDTEEFPLVHFEVYILQRYGFNLVRTINLVDAS